MASTRLATIDDDDDRLTQAVFVVRECQRVSASLLQRHLHVDYDHAHRLLSRLEALGVISDADGTGRRQVIG